MGKETSYVSRVSADRAVLWRNKAPILRSLDIELTERCNHDCIHCYINRPADDKEARKKELSSEEIKSVIREAVSLGCLSVRFTGGEPLIRGDFEEIYVFARKSGLKVSLFTNATLLDETKAKLFVRIPPLEKIEISLYGITKAAYESVTRNPGSFDAAMRGVDVLIRNDVPLIFKTIVLPRNRADMDGIEKRASSLPWPDPAPIFTVPLNLRGRRDSEERNETIRTLRFRPEEEFGFNTRTPRHRELYIREAMTVFKRIAGPRGDLIFTCGAGSGTACLDSAGTIQPCLLLRHPAAVLPRGKGTLRDAVTEFFPALRETRSRNPEYLRRCARCFLFGFCEQCPAQSWMENGTLDTPVEYLCAAAHHTAREMGLLRNGEKAWDIEDWQKRVGVFTKGV